MVRWIRCVQCPRPVHPTRGGAWCEVHTPQDLTGIPVAPVERVERRFAQLVTDAEIAEALRASAGNFSQAAARLGVSRQAVAERARKRLTAGAA